MPIHFSEVGLSQGHINMKLSEKKYLGIIEPFLLN